MATRSPSDDRPEALPVKITAALERLGRTRRGLRQATATRRGLTPLQADLLASLADGRSLPPTVGRLARDVAVSQPTATDSLAALAAKGLVARRRDPTDGRRAHVELTAAGRRLAATLGDGDDDLAAALAALPRGVQEAALETLLTLLARLVERGAVDTARTCLTCRFHRSEGRAHRCARFEVRFPTAGLRVDCGDHEAA